MLFSFVLPAYKAKFLSDAIKSILSQTYEDFELIIVNDASPENLDEIVSEFKDDRIRYYKNETNIGGEDLVAQWNHSISYARGKYLILASDDDLYHQGFLSAFVPLISKYPNADIFRPRIQFIDEFGEITNVEGFCSETLSQIEYCYLGMKGMLFGGVPFYIFKTEALTENGGFVKFPLAWYSDNATAISLAKNKMITTNRILFSFRRTKYSLTDMFNNETAMMKKISAANSYEVWLRNFNFTPPLV